ncbi:MAG: FkbM family methyltransferase [Burkholderiaceae bacterium]|nr:FkbM family methyltransferase [Burkholderiaceae bacterium]
MPFLLILIALLSMVIVKLIFELKKNRQFPVLPQENPNSVSTVPKISIDIYVPPPFRLIQSRHGTMIVNTNDRYMGRAIIEYGECCEPEIKLITQFLSVRPGTVLEIGTNIGTHTIPIAKTLKVIRKEMVVFEPQPVIFQNLCANLTLNGLTNVRAWPWACANYDGVVHFTTPDYRAEGNFGGVSMQSGDLMTGTQVPCVKLDNVANLNTVGFMKVDVEGFELQVLQGAEKLISDSRPVIYVENDRPENSESLIEWLWAHQYQLWWHLPPLFSAENFFKNSKNIYGDIVSINMLCIPRELNYPVRELEEVLTNVHPLQNTI